MSSPNISGASSSSGGGKISVGGKSCPPSKTVDIGAGTPPTSSGGSGGGGSACESCFLYTNIIFVDPNGDDNDAVVGDEFKPCQTIGGAEFLAGSGDLIWIMPGAYTITNAGKDNVQYYLNPQTTLTGNFTDGGNAITFSIHGQGTITNSGVTISQTGASTITIFDTTIQSSGDNAVVNQTAGTIKFTRADIVNTSSGSSAHGITTTITSSTYNTRLEDMHIILTSSTAEAINASNTYSVFCITDIGSTNQFNTNVTNYHPGTFMYTEPLLAV